MTKEFNLSEKRKRLLAYLIEQFGKDSLIPQDIMSFVEEADKEFIRLLKYKCMLNFIHSEDYNEFEKQIEKLAGEKLR